MLDLIEFYTAGTIAIIGIIEWLKHLNIKNFKRVAPYISLILCILAGIFAAKSSGKLDAWGVFCYCGGLLSFVQLGYQAVVESICGAIDHYLKRNTDSSTKAN